MENLVFKRGSLEDVYSSCHLAHFDNVDAAGNVERDGFVVAVEAMASHFHTRDVVDVEGLAFGVLHADLISLCADGDFVETDTIGGGKFRSHCGRSCNECRSFCSFCCVKGRGETREGEGDEEYIAYRSFHDAYVWL